MNEIIKRHYAYSSERLNAFSDELDRTKMPPEMDEFCIYTCGAYARHEANENSGIDISLVATAATSPVSQASQVLVDADIKRIVRKHKLAAFYDNGELINISYLDEMVAMAGTPNETADGLFHRRMLFLLESAPVFNKTFYEKALSTIIASYIQDYHHYTTDFPAVFLVNDIIRFWKTNILHQEHCRDFRRLSPALAPLLHFENLKLVYSTKLTCYSTIIQLLCMEDVFSVEHVLKIVRMKPLERILNLKGRGSDIDQLVDQIVEMYCNYLSVCQRNTEWIEQYLADTDSRSSIFSLAKRDFNHKLCGLIAILTKHKPEVLHSLLI